MLIVGSVKTRKKERMLFKMIQQSHYYCVITNSLDADIKQS